MPDDLSFDRLTTLPSLGWSDFFSDQLDRDETELVPCRIAAIHRDRLSAISEAGLLELVLSTNANTGQFAVGDWVLVDVTTLALRRRLDRRTVLERGTAGSRDLQLGAANVDTLFIVTSCNAEFNLARLERYLVLANQGGTDPVILLTKADLVDDAADYQRRAAALQRGLAVVILNPRSPEAPAALSSWCRFGQTVAMVGSSGVGKSSLVNRLTASGELQQPTGEIREHDAKGRHPTTARSLHGMAGGGWVIDTPGMRTLQMSESPHGLAILFAEITELAPLCRFRDCTHAHEPGCAVQAAVRDGRIDSERLSRWRKLSEENAKGTFSPIGPRGNKSAAGGTKRR